MTSVRLRAAGPDDAGTVAWLHADSWRRFYRGAYADSFLDGDVVAERRSVWSARLADARHNTPSARDRAACRSARRPRTETVLAEDGTGPVGFVHVVFDEDDRWGSLIDNLHVTHDRRRGGIGAALLTYAAGAVGTWAAGRALYLWVLEQNTAAQRFYAAFGGSCVEAVPVSAPGGVPTRLVGAPNKLRIAWPDCAAVRRAGG